MRGQLLANTVVDLGAVDSGRVLHNVEWTNYLLFSSAFGVWIWFVFSRVCVRFVLVSGGWVFLGWFKRWEKEGLFSWFQALGAWCVCVFFTC